MTARTSHQPILRNPHSRLRLWTGLLGGATAWLIRFLLIYAISEWRCTPPPDEGAFLGLTTTAWLIICVSILLFAAAVGAATLSLRSVRARRRERPEVQEGDVEWFMAQAGMVLSGLFAFIILIETIPVFYLGPYC